jgi:hypothetical protein
MSSVHKEKVTGWSLSFSSLYLLKDSADGKGKGVTIHSELLVELGLL